MTFGTVRIGPTAVPEEIVAAIIAIILARISLRPLLSRTGNSEAQTDTRAFFDTASTALIIAFFVWKLWPLVRIPREIAASPGILLRSPGGPTGAAVGALAGVFYYLVRIIRRSILSRPAVTTAFGTALVALYFLLFAAIIPTDKPSIPEGATSDIAFQMLDGRTVRSVDLRGKPVLLSFWATWCGPCRAELPDKIRIYSDFHDSVTVIGVNMTRSEAGLEAVRRYADENDIPFPIALDVDGSLASLFGVRGTPTTVILDDEGEVVYRRVGPASYDRLARVLR